MATQKPRSAKKTSSKAAPATRTPAKKAPARKAQPRKTAPKPAPRSATALRRDPVTAVREAGKKVGGARDRALSGAGGLIDPQRLGAVVAALSRELAELRERLATIQAENLELKKRLREAGRATLARSPGRAKRADRGGKAG